MAYNDAVDRSAAALRSNPDFFNNPAHVATVVDVTTILEDFFLLNKGIYETCRSGRKSPFTSVKVNAPKWTAEMQCNKKVGLIEPLTRLGSNVEIVKCTTGYIVHIN